MTILRTAGALFWAVLGMVAITGVAGFRLGSDLVRCYSLWRRLSDLPICGSIVWGGEWLPLAVIGVVVATLAVATTMAITTLWRQFTGARRLERHLRGNVAIASDRLMRATERSGISSVECVAIAEPIAITVGVVAPRVLVTEGLVNLLTDVELEAVLAHEAAHVRGNHPVVYALARSMASAAFPLPALRVVAQRIVLACEVSADSAAIAKCGRAALVRALSKLEAASRLPDSEQVAAGAVGGMLEWRIRALAGLPMSGPKATRSDRWLTAMGCIFLSVLPVAIVVAYLRALGLL